MNNIIIQKGIQEVDLIELNIFVETEYAKIKQYCYVDKFMLENAHNKIKKFINTLEKTYVEFGHKEGNYTPAFSMEIEKLDLIGNVRIEVDLEINDNKERKHWCQLYLHCNLGEIERFGEKLYSLISVDSTNEIKLIE